MDASPPIPPPLDSDDEDVYLALSTARTLWNRGERDDALRWLRRAAEKASDADEDARALDLFKAAAELSSKIASMPAVAVAVPAPAPPIQRSSSPPPASSGPPAGYTSARPSAPPPPLPAAAKAGPPPLPRAAPAVPKSAAPPQQPPLQQPSGRRGTRTGGRAPAAPPPAVRAAPTVEPRPAAQAPARVPAQAPPVRPRIDSPQRDSAAPPSVAVPSAARPPVRPPSTDKMSAVRYEASQPPPSAYVQAVHNQGGRSSVAPSPPVARTAAAAPVARSAAPVARSAAPAAAGRGAVPGRAASTSGGRRRTVNQRSPFYEDDITAQRQIPIQAQPRVLPDLVESTTADSDEATAILQGGLFDEDASAQKQAVHQVVQQAIARATAAQREEPAASHVITSAPPIAAPAPEPAARKSAWPAARVAVVKTAAGVQLMAMGQGEHAPPGAAVAVLIPMSETDGAVLAQLLGISG